MVSVMIEVVNKSPLKSAEWEERTINVIFIKNTCLNLNFLYQNTPKNILLNNMKLKMYVVSKKSKNLKIIMIKNMK